MIDFIAYTKKIKQDLLKPITLFLKVTNTSNKTIEIAKELFEVEILENGEKADGFTRFYDENMLTYVTLKPNDFFETKCDIKYYMTFQYTYKNKNQIEKFNVLLNAKFFVKGLPYSHTKYIKQKNSLELEVDFTSVELLLTPKNNTSKYIKYNESIVYISEYSRAYEKPSKKINIDKNSLKIINRIYIIDKDKVFKDGNLQRLSPNGFKVFNGLFAGNHEKILTTYGDAKVKDPKSFEGFNVYEDVNTYKKGYGRDKFYLYFFNESTSTTHATICKPCKNPSTFKELYTKDENYEIYGICERTVYINGVSISMADAKTWKDLGMYSKDKKNVFYFTYKVKGADPNSFLVIKDPEAGKYDDYFKKTKYQTLEESRWGKDKNHYYNCGKQSNKEKYLEKKEKYEKKKRI